MTLIVKPVGLVAFRGMEVAKERLQVSRLIGRLGVSDARDEQSGSDCSCQVFCSIHDYFFVLSGGSSIHTDASRKATGSPRDGSRSLLIVRGSLLGCFCSGPDGLFAYPSLSAEQMLRPIWGNVYPRPMTILHRPFWTKEDTKRQSIAGYNRKPKRALLFVEGSALCPYIRFRWSSAFDL